MPPLPAPLHGLDRGFITGPQSPRAPDSDAWAAWEAHLDAGRIGAGSVTLLPDEAPASHSEQTARDGRASLLGASSLSKS